MINIWDQKQQKITQKGKQKSIKYTNNRYERLVTKLKGTQYNTTLKEQIGWGNSREMIRLIFEGSNK